MDFNEYQREARTTAIYPVQHNILYPALGLAGEAGEVAEKVKKMLRDDMGDLTDDRKEQIKKELGDVLWYIASLSHDCGLSMDEIATANIAKLKSRKERGVLQGNGDNR